jgi:hypothetical protein
VLIDPTVRIQPDVAQAADTFIDSASPTSSFATAWALPVGTHQTGTYRSLAQFDLSAVPPGTRVDSARLQTYFDLAHTSWANPVQVEARRVTQAWTPATTTWNSVNTRFAEIGTNSEQVDDADAGKVALGGTWQRASTSLAVAGSYLFDKDAVTGESVAFVPTITEPGNYQVEVHYVRGPDRASAVPYTVHHANGTTPYTVNQSGTTAEVWQTLGTHTFNAGTSHKIVVGDVADPSKMVVADAVRLTKVGTDTMNPNDRNVWHSFSVRSTVQSWVDGSQPNYGFMLKAANESRKGQGGPVYNASDDLFPGPNGFGELVHAPKLLVTYGDPAVDLDTPACCTPPARSCPGARTPAATCWSTRCTGAGPRTSR